MEKGRRIIILPSTVGSGTEFIRILGAFLIIFAEAGLVTVKIIPGRERIAARGFLYSDSGLIWFLTQKTVTGMTNHIHLQAKAKYCSSREIVLTMKASFTLRVYFMSEGTSITR